MPRLAYARVAHKVCPSGKTYAACFYLFIYLFKVKNLMTPSNMQRNNVML